MSTVKVVRGARILTSELYGEPRPKMARPPRTVYFKCPESQCGFEHAQWSLVGQHLFNHHGYSQEAIDLEECEQRKTRRNKTWLKKRLAAVEAACGPFGFEDGNDIEGEEEENQDIDMKPTPMVLEAMRKMLPKSPFGPKEGCTCPIIDCGLVLPSRVELVNHAKDVHINDPTANGNFDIRTELFENEDDFKDWKLRLEDDFGMYYACESTAKQGECKNFFYVCHRSGRVFRRMKQMRERRIAARAAGEDLSSTKKRNKIVKSQEYCTAFMRVRKDSIGRFHVAYSTSHIGHDHDASMLPLSSIQKKIIYDRIVAEHKKASNSLIASRIREKYDNENSRLHYVTMADVLEVIRMERKRLARVGGDEAANAPEIFRDKLKKGRRKAGQELLHNGKRHNPPRPGVGMERRRRLREEEEDEVEMEMESKAHLIDYSRPIKLDEDEEEMEMGVGEEGVMDDDHAAYYDDEEVEEDEHVHADFMADDVVDDSILDTSQQEEDEDGMPHLAASSSRVVVVRPTQRGQAPQQPSFVMEEAVSNKHRMDEHVDNICEALVRNGDAAVLQQYLDAIRSVSSRYEHLLGS